MRAFGLTALRWLGVRRAGANDRPPVWFVRHGRTDWNTENRIQGQRDLPLNATGLDQAAQAAAKLAGVAGDRLGKATFLASPLMRATRTMELLRSHNGLPAAGYRTDPRLKGIGFGSWEGLTWEEIMRLDPVGVAASDRERWTFRPDGAGAESYAMLAERVSTLLAELDRPTVIVAHGGVARALFVLFGHLDTHTAARADVPQGSVLVLERDGWRVA